MLKKYFFFLFPLALCAHDPQDNNPTSSQAGIEQVQASSSNQTQQTPPSSSPLVQHQTNQAASSSGAPTQTPSTPLIEHQKNQANNFQQTPTDVTTSPPLVQHQNAQINSSNQTAPSYGALPETSTPSPLKEHVDAQANNAGRASIEPPSSPFMDHQKAQARVKETPKVEKPPRPKTLSRPPITPPDGPINGQNVDIIFDLELLYLYANSTNVSYATKYVSSNQQAAGNPSVLFATPEKIYEPSWNWDLGTRFGVGVVTNHDGWDVYSDWTWTYNSTEDSQVVPHYPSQDITSTQNPVGTQSLASTWFQNGTNTNFNYIKTRWSIQLNQFDIQLGRKFWISPKLTFRPFGGVRTHFSRMFLKVKGTYESNSYSGTISATADETAKRSQKLWTVGLLGGLQSTWHCSEYWGIYLDWAFSLLYGPFDLKTHINAFQTDQSGNVVSDVSYSFRHDDIYALQPIYDLAIGLRWGFPLPNAGYRLRVDAGWEAHLLPGFNHFDANVSASQNGATYLPAEGDLTISGAVIRTRIEF